VRTESPAGRNHAVTWRAQAGGVDECELLRRDDSWVLRGRVEGEIGWLGKVSATYEVVSDAEWFTVESVATVGGTQPVVVRRDDDGRWLANGREVPDVAGCEVVDLGFTPATNTLAIRRLGLGIGDSAEIDAAWVRFPDLMVQRLPQRYTRTGEAAYRYESGEFRADLEVDEHGLVTRYGDIWVAIDRAGGQSS
jgi:hypothetical protein